MLIGWDMGVLVYLVAAAVMMSRCSSVAADARATPRRRTKAPSRILILTVAAALASLGAIFAELATVERSSPDYGLYIALAIGTVVLSWTFIHTIFALHYAHEFYGDGVRARAACDFPGDDQPDYWDFVYFSFVIGMTFQVSDVRGHQQVDPAHGRWRTACCRSSSPPPSSR